jgi:DNA polymerase-3 subunit beta
VDRVSLINALRRVTLFASKSSNLVVLNIDSNEMVISAQDLDYSTAAEERVACSYEGNTMTIGFNGVFMVEILNNLNDESVVIRLSDPARPGLYSPLTQGEGENTVTIQMPMQVI